MNKKISVLIVLALLIAAAVFMVRHQQHVLTAAAPPSAWAVVVRNRVLGVENVRLTRPAAANVEAVAQTVLASRLSGYVGSMPLFEGARFKRGDLLATIEMSQSEGSALQGNSLKTDLAAAESSLLAAHEHLRRSRALYRLGGVSLEELQAEEAAFAAARARQAAARENLRNAALRAPFDGVLAARLAQPGDMATPGKPLLRIVALGPQRVLVDVPQETSVSGLLLAGKMYSAHPWPEATTQGLRRWEARVDGLMPGSTVDVDIVTFAGKGIFIPGDCMLDNDGRHADLLRLPSDSKSSAVVERIELFSGGVEGAVAMSSQLAGVRVACASPDVLARLAGGAPYNIAEVR